MKENLYKLTMGALLHDVGKLCYRNHDGRNHSESGVAFLKEQCQIRDSAVLAQVHYHHSQLLRNANLAKNSLAYVTYIADNIAAATDRRENDSPEKGFEKDAALQTVFGLLNGQSKPYYYPQAVLDQQAIHYPQIKAPAYTPAFYDERLRNIKENVQCMECSEAYLNSLLAVMEANLSFVPSSTAKAEVADISLYDHSKMTAAFATTIYTYLCHEGIEDYHAFLFQNASAFYQKEVFLLYSLDISGIQDFIYNVTSDGALKALRARSFYLELLMEHMADTLLEILSLSRANLIYTGGGHAYLLLANTEQTKAKIQAWENQIKAWFMDAFHTDLYVAGGYASCSAESLKNEPDGSYRMIFQNVSGAISEKKLARYTAQDICMLNHQSLAEDARECRSCHRMGNVASEGRCSLCEGLVAFSKRIQKDAFYGVTKQANDALLPLPFGYDLVAVSDQETMKAKIKEDGFHRFYCKNKFHAGYHISTNLWVGDYQNGEDFKDFASSSEGIKRIGVLRADIDNLGKAFVDGFSSRFASLSRTATFSRKLSMFFKHDINLLLAQREYMLQDDDNEDIRRKASIVYSGGDDVFIVGEWSDIIGFAVDLHDNLASYTQKKLTISGGIGIFPEKYPVLAMAEQVGNLESMAKDLPNKNGIALFDQESVYDWETFIDDILETKYRIIQDFFSKTTQKGKSFIYKMVDLMRSSKEKLNVARFAYLLARMEPDNNAPQESKDRYDEFSKRLYQWTKDPKECSQAITALYIYVYTIREQTEGVNHRDTK